MSLSDDLRVEHFKHLCEQTRHFNDKLTESFTFHITTLSAIVGGSIWLAVDKKSDVIAHKASLVALSNGLVGLLTFVTLVRVLGNWFAWRGMRQKQHEALADVPEPHWFWSAWLELGLALAVGAGFSVFWAHNPFAVLLAN